MNKTEFVDAVAKEAGASKVAAAQVVNAAIAVITKSLKKGVSIQITGFGTFDVAKRQPAKKSKFLHLRLRALRPALF